MLLKCKVLIYDLFFVYIDKNKFNRSWLWWEILVVYIICVF